MHAPYGAHPTSIAGYYDYDYAFLGSAMRNVGRSQEDYQAFAAEWIDGIADHAAYVEHYREVFGREALEGLAAHAGTTPEAGVLYGYAPGRGFQ